MTGLEQWEQALRGSALAPRLRVGDVARAIIESQDARIAELEAVVEALLLLIGHETNLPDCAANGVVAHGTDEGVYRAGMMLEEARVTLAARAAEGGKS